MNLKPSMSIVAQPSVAAGSSGIPARCSEVSVPDAEQGCSAHPQAGKPAPRAAFTLIEMLVVIAVIGIVAAISVPALKNISKSDAAAAGTRQLLDDIARARQFAISRRTTVYMVFVPAGFWTDFPYNNQNLFNNLSTGFNARDRQALTNVLDKQLVGYNFVTLRDIGDQPGHSRARYLQEWRSLPEGVYIPPTKFTNSSAFTAVYNPLNGSLVKDVRGFEVVRFLPFPSPETDPAGGGYIYLPCIAFNYQGQLVSPAKGRLLDEEVIPVVRGRVAQSRSPGSKLPQQGLPDVREDPLGNSTNSYNLIVVNGLTGRASIESL